MFNTSGASLADIAAVTGNNRNGAFGDDLWAVILLFALFGRGFGGFAGAGTGSCGCAPATCADLQSGFDNQAVVNKLNGLENGLCSLGYDQLNQMNGINMAIAQGNFGLSQAITNMGVANMQDTNALSRQLADCCCDMRSGIKDIQFQNSQDTCAITNAIQNQTQQIMQNDNANYRALHDELVGYQMQQKNETIAELRSQVNALNLAVSQRNQNDYLVERLDPCAKPAYIVANPNCCPTPQQIAAYYNANGCNAACGC